MTFVPFRAPHPTIYGDFVPTVLRLLPCRMIDDRHPFDEAWTWCDGNCAGLWRLECDRDGRGPVFAFELEQDGLHFALTFEESRPF